MTLLTTWASVALLAALPLFALSLSLFNLAVWPRGSRRAAGESESRRAAVDGISVLVPARNEEDSIESCIRSIYAGSLAPDEVLVYDDRSEDGTPEILANLRREYETLRILEGEPLPDEWVGKPHACHRLQQEADGETLVFVDADTTLRETGLERLVSLLENGPAGRTDLITAVPRQQFGTLAEALVVPLLHVTYTSWLPLPLIWRTDDPRFLAANGQLLGVRSDALEAVGGFEAVRSEIVDDVALARLFKRHARPVLFADGAEMADCRMYDSWSGVREGFSKNLYEGIGENVFALAGVVALYVVTFLLPWIVAPVAWAFGWSHVAIAAAGGIACNLLLRAALGLRFGHPASSILLHPVGIALLVAIAVNSFNWSRRDALRWAGRTYAARSRRGSPSEEGGGR